MIDSRAWARAWAIARPPKLRTGAWYPVVSRGRRLAVLDVHRQHVAVSQHLLEFRERRPTKFTVVYRADDDPNPARGTLKDLGRIYAVCPECTARVRLYGTPDQVRCPACRHRGSVAYWETG